MIKLITELGENELKGKKVLLRVDFNVPVENGKITETYRIKTNKETIDYLLNRGAKITLLSHITSVPGFEPLIDQIRVILGTGNFSLFENIRKFEGEEKNDADFAKELAKSFDIYINNAFSVSHRNHASLVAITKFLPSFGGFLLIKEIENLKKAVEMPKEGKTLILGGAKIETKFPVISNFVGRAENVLVGGAIANVFFKAKGIDIKKSLSDDNFLENAKKFLENNPNIIIPEDFVFSGESILDIGKNTTNRFIDVIRRSKMIVWNGPLGKVEMPEFSHNSEEIAKAIIKSGAFSVAGGGDTLAFIEKLGFMEKFSYVSTGGGAMLEFLAGKKLPGLESLGYYNE
jgi:phosphoglycerate kinase